MVYQLEQIGSPLGSSGDRKDELVVRGGHNTPHPRSNQLSSRGLAQKLAIRLGKHYPQSKLVEINAHSLGSKFFGESGKLVGRLFESIASSLEEEEDTFFCVFIDEIETIAARRERALSGNEPFDAIRAVNALLTGLDKLRSYPNVVTICTSNLVNALVRCSKITFHGTEANQSSLNQDEAFLDRVDIKQFMPHLSNRAIYGIYKDCLEELNRCEIVQGCRSMSFKPTRRIRRPLCSMWRSPWNI